MCLYIGWSDYNPTDNMVDDMQYENGDERTEQEPDDATYVHKKQDGKKLAKHMH